MRELALWGVRSLGPPRHDDELAPGWLEHALDTVFAPVAPPGRFEFRIGDEVASLVDGEAARRAGRGPGRRASRPTSRASTTCSSSAAGTAITVDGDRELLERLLESVAPVPSAPVAA